VLVLAGAGLLVGCADTPTEPEVATILVPIGYAQAPNACWGQATRVFAQLGEMGQHSSQQPTPRVGLANLARLLYDGGVIVEPTLQALGAFVADELGLAIDACMGA
jgi:hypothetical protein